MDNKEMTDTFDHVVTLRQCSLGYGASVLLDDEEVMTGAEHDFHPYCHGIHEWGPFQGSECLAAMIRLNLEAKGKTVRVDEPEGYFDYVDTHSGEWIDGEYVEPPPPPPPPPKTPMSKTVHKLLDKLDNVLNEVSSISSKITEGDATWEFENASPELLKAWEDFDATIDWRKYHAFQRALRQYTDYVPK